MYKTLFIVPFFHKSESDSQKKLVEMILSCMTKLRNMLNELQMSYEDTLLCGKNKWNGASVLKVSNETLQSCRQKPQSETDILSKLEEMIREVEKFNTTPEKLLSVAKELDDLQQKFWRQYYNPLKKLNAEKKSINMEVGSDFEMIGSPGFDNPRGPMSLNDMDGELMDIQEKIKRHNLHHRYTSLLDSIEKIRNEISPIEEMMDNKASIAIQQLYKRIENFSKTVDAMITEAYDQENTEFLQKLDQPSPKFLSLASYDVSRCPDELYDVYTEFLRIASNTVMSAGKNVISRKTFDTFIAPMLEKYQALSSLVNQFAIFHGNNIKPNCSKESNDLVDKVEQLRSTTEEVIKLLMPDHVKFIDSIKTLTAQLDVIKNDVEKKKIHYENLYGKCSNFYTLITTFLNSNPEIKSSDPVPLDKINTMLNAFKQIYSVLSRPQNPKASLPTRY